MSTTMARPAAPSGTANPDSALVVLPTLTATRQVLKDRGFHRGDWTGNPDGTGACCLVAALRVAAGLHPVDDPGPRAGTDAGRRYHAAAQLLADHVVPVDPDADEPEDRITGLIRWSDGRQDAGPVLALLGSAIAELAPGQVA